MLLDNRVLTRLFWLQSASQLHLSAADDVRKTISSVVRSATRLACSPRTHLAKTRGTIQAAL